MKNTIENLTKAFIGESQARNRYIFGLEAPKKCPCCDHAQAYYQVQCENY